MSMLSRMVNVHGSWWCWWLFLDMRTKWKKASARPRLGSNRALRQRPTNSLLQTSKPGRSLFVLGVFFFVLSFRLLLLLDLLGVFGFACLYRDLWCDWCTPSTWRSTSTWRSPGRQNPPRTWNVQKTWPSLGALGWWRKGALGGGRLEAGWVEQTKTCSLDNCCLKT